VEEASGMYNVTLSYQENEIPVYVTKDGNYVFLAAPVNLEEEIPTSEQTEQTEQPTEVVKTDRPEAHAFIMSYCPYGLQFLKAYVPVIELLGDKADLEVNFVHYIMHGEKEATENTRMYCIQNMQSDKFTDYLRCFVESTDAATCIASVGIDENSLNACMENTDQQFEITKTLEESESTYPAYAVDGVLAQQYGVGGSPTFVLNGVTVSVNRAAEAIKQAICSAFNTPPAECDTVLSTEAEAAGAGPIGSGGGSGSTATC
jgi:protein-disulfide isomerase